MKKLIPIILILITGAGGFFGGHMLKPSDAVEGEHKETEMAEVVHEAQSGEANAEYVKFSRQFVVPVVEGSEIISLIVADIQLEMKPGSSEEAFAREPKIRDSFLKVLYRHSHSGTLKGSIVSDRTLKELRDDLFASAQKILGDNLSDVLITDLLRQDR